MALGMTYDEYWYGDVLMARAFLSADKERQKRINDMAWLFGAYVYKALNATVGNIMLKEGEKPFQYPEKPIELDAEKAIKEREEKAAQEQEMERVRLVAHLNQIIAAREQA